MDLGGVDTDFGFVDIIEIRKKLIIITLANWVIFVVVALGTADGHAQPDGACGVGAVDGALDPELFWVGSTFFVEGGISMESCGQNLFLGCIWD